MAVLDPPMQIMAEQQNPIGWARVRSIQGEYLAEIGRREGNREALVQARAAFEEARKLFADNGLGETGQGFWQEQIAAIDRELAR